MQSNNPSRFPFIIVPVIVALAWCFWVIVGVGVLGTSSHCTGDAATPMASLGQFGDMFGVLSCIMTGIGMVCAIYAARLQNKQIQDQQRQLNDQKADELKAFRREKLYQLMREMSTLRKWVMDGSLHFHQKPTMDKYEWWFEVSHPCSAAHYDATTTVEIYFGKYFREIMPPPPMSGDLKFNDQLGRLPPNTEAYNLAVNKIVEAFKAYTALLSSHMNATMCNQDNIIKNLSWVPAKSLAPNPESP